MSDIINFEQNQKFVLLVKTAKELFYKFGIKRVTIEEICQTAGVSKMTFYKFFANKIELAKYLLVKIISEVEEKYNDIIESKISFQEKIRLIIELKLKETENISSEFVSDLLKYPHPALEKTYAQRRNEILARFVEFLADAQKAGDIRQDIDLQFILYILNRMVEMAADSTLIKIYDKPHDLIAETINFFFYGILKENR